MIQGEPGNYSGTNKMKPIMAGAPYRALARSSSAARFAFGNPAARAG
jgi:hypothetical protein